MKVGILTFHAAHNFGAMLQAYALQEQIRINGHEPWIINYVPEYIASKRPTLQKWMFTHGRALQTIKYYFKIMRKAKKSYDKYKYFAHEYMKLTNICNIREDLSSICRYFDCIILGSDQIWNIKFNGKDSVWFGDIEGFKGKLILYAASAGDKVLDKDIKNILQKKIYDFSAISVRESHLAQQISNIETKLKISVVLDPSLMVDPKIWHKWQIPIRTDKYIVTYQAREDENVFRIATEISNQIGHECKILNVDFWNSSFRKGVEKAIVSPSEFISLIHNSQCVITTSFHGTAFSIINEVPFYTLYLNDGADGRSEELLNKLGLTERMVDKTASPQFTSINYNLVNKKLNILRSASQDFLKASI